MKISPAKDEDQPRWNKFIKDNYPPVGAFMQTWEWGQFSHQTNRPIYRYFILDQEKTVALFTLIEQKLPLGMSYGYVPRGPVIAQDCQTEDSLLDIFKTIRTFIIKNHPHLLFVRLEPPINKLESTFRHHGFYLPNYYIQPRHNHFIKLEAPEKEILAGFHSSTRSNIKRAERREVKVQVKDHRVETDYDDWQTLAEETKLRNHGQQIYPGQNYFTSLFAIIPPLLASTKHVSEQPTLLTLYGYQQEQLLAIHFVIFFGDTATYLYGASDTAGLPSKVTTYLHWQAMREAKQRGLKYYDLGAVDARRWPTLTDFKRQFQGEESHYLGNIDIPLNPRLYKLYNLIRKIRH